MQKVNVNTPITITGRHVEVTDAIREFVTKKIEGIRLDFPRIMEVKVLLDVQRDRKISQVILFCSDHITIDASTEGTDMYACIDETITKIMRFRAGLPRRFPGRPGTPAHSQRKLQSQKALQGRSHHGTGTFR